MATVRVETPTPTPPPPSPAVVLTLTEEEAGMLSRTLMVSVLWEGEFGQKMRDIFYALYEAGVEEKREWKPTDISGHTGKVVSRIWKKRS